MLPLRREAKIRCIEFWHRVVNMGEERLMKRAAMEALSLRGRVKWLRNLQLELCFTDLRWEM